MGKTYREIEAFLNVSKSAIQYTYEKQKATPEHVKAGKRSKIQGNELKRLEDYVISLKKTRRMTYKELALALWPDESISYQAVKHALYQLGYQRRVAIRKPPITKVNRVIRLQWA
jgi:hypothetical protein